MCVCVCVCETEREREKERERDMRLINSFIPNFSQNPLDMSLVNKMTAALMQKAKQVAKWRVSLLAWSMADYVEGKLKSIVEKDPHSREMFLAIEQEVTVVSGGAVPHRTSEGNTVSAVFKVFESFGKMIRDLQSLDVWS